MPSERELMGSALSSLVRQPEHAAGALRRTLGAVRDLAERNRRLREEDELEPPPAPFRAPRTSLNGAISPHRRFAFTPGAAQRHPTGAEVFGGTVNDIVLAAVAGALRRLLAERGEELDDSLVAMVPMSTRTEADTGCARQQGVGHARVARHDGGRPRGASRHDRGGDEAGQGPGPRSVRRPRVGSWAQLAFPALSARVARLAGNLRVFDHVPPLFNVVVSNIVGPDFPLWCAGARLVALYPVGPIIEGVGLNVTVVSYEGTLYVGILGCRDLVPEVDHLGDHLSDAFGELVKAAVRNGGHWA